MFVSIIYLENTATPYLAEKWTSPKPGTQIYGVDHLLPEHNDTLPAKIMMWAMI
jgi:hypothetical protein